ncbi:MAG: FtsW/RodA/SpoVE family cell cycle protein [Saprospiraceae bacterium]
MTNVIQLYHQLRGDRAIWLIVALLSLFSLLAVYSAAGSMAFKLREGNTEYYLVQQFMFLSSGLLLMWLCYKLDYQKYARFAPYLMALAVPLLIYTMFFGTEMNEARRWITIPWIDKTFQTSDFAEIALILFLAKSLATKQEYIKDFKSAFLPIILPVILICGLIAPANLSTAALLFVTSITLMFIGRISLKYVFLLIMSGLLTGFAIYKIGLANPEFVRSKTWETRVKTFLNSSDEVYQIQQSKIAIASGKVFGVGPGNSIQRNHLPYAYADCIYAIICEEYGIIGGLLVLWLYLWLLIRCINIVTKSPRAFGGILAMGLCLNLVVQAFANISVSVQLVPATGLTLPLISMGGTSLLFTSISLGIILSVSRNAEQAEIERMELKAMEAKNESSN